MRRKLRGEISFTVVETKRVLPTTADVQPEVSVRAGAVGLWLPPYKRRSYDIPTAFLVLCSFSLRLTGTRRTGLGSQSGESPEFLDSSLCTRVSRSFTFSDKLLIFAW
jgi:hypothetical protein